MITSKKLMTLALAVAGLTAVSIAASSDASARGGFGGGFGGGRMGGGGFQGMGGRHALVTPRPLPPGLNPTRPGVPPGAGVKPGKPGNPPGAGKPPGYHGHGHRYFGLGVVGVGYNACLRITPY